MSELEVIITIDVEEYVVDLGALNKQPPCFLILDSTQLLIHTLYNMYHYGLTKFTIIAPEELKPSVESFIQVCTSIKPRCLNTDLSNAIFDTGYFQKGQSAFQVICEKQKEGKIVSQNVMIMSSSTYFDVPPSIIMDVHRNSNSTLSIIHSSKQDGKKYDRGCFQIQSPLKLQFDAKEVGYDAHEVQFYISLNKERLGDQEHLQIEIPTTIITDNHEAKCYHTRPVGIVLATELIQYLNKTNMIKKAIVNDIDGQKIVDEKDIFQIDLYEEIITFLLEQQQLPNSMKHPRIQNYLCCAFERQLDIINNDTFQTPFLLHKLCDVRQKKSFDDIFDQYADKMLDDEDVFLATQQPREIKICSIQFHEPATITYETSMDHSRAFQHVRDKLDEFCNVNSDTIEQLEQSRQNSVADFYKNPLGGGSALVFKGVMTPKIDRQQQNFKTNRLDYVQELKLSDLNGGIFQVETREQYINLTNLVHNFVLQRLYKFPSMSLKFRIVDFQFWKFLSEQSSAEINMSLKKQLLWVSNQETLKNIDEQRITQSNIHSQKEFQEQQAITTEGYAIAGELENCIVEQQVLIGAEVKLKNCIIFRGTVLQGSLEFENCVFGAGSQFIQRHGTTHFSNCCFKATYKYEGILSQCFDELQLQQQGQ